MFPCTSCGLCCQNILGIKELSSYDLGNGVCKYFDAISNGCKVYDNRPIICNIDEMFRVKYQKQFSKEVFYMENAKVCNALQEKYKLDKSYRIREEI